MPETKLSIRERLGAIAASDCTIAFDGCHKIYLIFSQADRLEANLNGYEASDIHPASAIHKLWIASCGLRFVSPIDLDRTHPWTIEQGEEES